MPSWVPMARAVSAWSPVIIFTAMPARRHSATAAMASSRGGSMMPTRASRVMPPSTSAKFRLRCSALAGRVAMASRRRPRAARSVAWRRQ
ncbi:hypothetical protein D9M70_532640 [compost metagenome]